MRATFQDHSFGLQGAPNGHSWPKKTLKYYYTLMNVRPAKLLGPYQICKSDLFRLWKYL